MISIPLYLSEHHECSYLPDELARTAFVHPSLPLSTELYSHLIEQGFRRSGNDIYVPRCQLCVQCVSVRIPVAEFHASRRQRRCWNKNLSTTARITPPDFKTQHYQLYLSYQSLRHPSSSMANSSPEEYISFLGSSWCDTLFVEFFISGQLVAVAIIDQLKNALSAVYTFFDPANSHLSLGTYAILWQLDYARQLGLDYVYLGYWVKDCDKMNYKNQYQPLQGLINRQWQAVLPEHQVRNDLQT